MTAPRLDTLDSGLEKSQLPTWVEHLREQEWIDCMSSLESDIRDEVAEYMGFVPDLSESVHLELEDEFAEPSPATDKDRLRTLKEVGEEFHISRARAQQLILQALGKARTAPDLESVFSVHESAWSLIEKELDRKFLDSDVLSKMQDINAPAKECLGVSNAQRLVRVLDEHAEACDALISKHNAREFAKQEEARARAAAAKARAEAVEQRRVQEQTQRARDYQERGERFKSVAYDPKFTPVSFDSKNPTAAPVSYTREIERSYFEEYLLGQYVQLFGPSPEFYKIIAVGHIISGDCYDLSATLKTRYGATTEVDMRRIRYATRAQLAEIKRRMDW